MFVIEITMPFYSELVFYTSVERGAQRTGVTLVPRDRYLVQAQGSCSPMG